MATHRRLQPPPPVLQGRLLLKFLSLLFMTVFMFWAIWKAGDPRTWAWLAGNRPAAAIDTAPPPAAETTGDKSDSPPEPRQDEEKKPGVIPSLPVAMELLERALDKEPFLQPDPKDETKDPEAPGVVRLRGDAKARYHLMLLAGSDTLDPKLLTAHAIRFPTNHDAHDELKQKPDEYRGKVVHIEGRLGRAAPFPVREKAEVGDKPYYQAWLTIGKPDRTVCVLFSELPAGFPPESEWDRLLLDVQVDGFFLKVVKTLDHNNKPIYSPVLVARTIQLPPPGSTFNLGVMALIIGGVFVATLLLCFVAVWFYRRGDRRLSQRMAELRERGGLPPEFLDFGPTPPEPRNERRRTENGE